MPADIFPHAAIPAFEIGEGRSMGGTRTSMHTLCVEQREACPMHRLGRNAERRSVRFDAARSKCLSGS